MALFPNYFGSLIHRRKCFLHCAIEIISLSGGESDLLRTEIKHGHNIMYNCSMSCLSTRLNKVKQSAGIMMYVASLKLYFPDYIFHIVII